MSASLKRIPMIEFLEVKFELAVLGPNISLKPTTRQHEYIAGG